jgi:hypothetical protein
MEVASSPERSVFNYKWTLCHIPGELNILMLITGSSAHASKENVIRPLNVNETLAVHFANCHFTN